MSKYRLVGLETVKIGTTNTTTFAMPTTFTTVTNLVPGTAILAIEMPSKTKYFVEDHDYADMVITEDGAKTIEFATRDMVLSNFVLGMGGSVSSSVWSASTTPRGVVEKAIELTSKTYIGVQHTFEIARAEFSGGAELRFSNKGATEPGVLTFAAEVLMGYNTSDSVYVSPMVITRS